MTKQFTTALKAAEQTNDEEEFITFSFDDGPEFRAYPPLPSQFAVAMAALGGRHNLETRLAAIVDFMMEVVEPDGASYMTERLLNRTDPFGLDELTQLMEWMVEEWSARPTVKPSGSTRSASSGGQRSRRPTTRAKSSASA